ncbi:MAG: hypothetical protein O7G86_00955 [Gammaproteobacteria bacterium]|nr:hypothetical protein [Gammaproteobacteria bacterium]
MSRPSFDGPSGYRAVCILHIHMKQGVWVHEFKPNHLSAKFNNRRRVIFGKSVVRARLVNGHYFTDNDK